MNMMVKVTRTDTTIAPEGWHSQEDCQKGCLTTIVSIGYMVGDDGKVIILAKNYCPDSKRYNMLTAIPKASVVSMDVLKGSFEEDKEKPKKGNK